MMEISGITEALVGILKHIKMDKEQIMLTFLMLETEKNQLKLAE